MIFHSIFYHYVATYLTPLSIPVSLSSFCLLFLSQKVNRPVELYTQLHAIRPDIFDDYNGFVKRYCDAKDGLYGEQNVKGSSNETELKNILHHTVMIRRLKSDVLHELAVKSREIRKIDADPVHLDEYKAMDRMYQSILKKISSRGSGFQKDLESEKTALQTQQYQQTGLCKVKAVVKELEELVLEARRFSVSSSSSTVVDEIEEMGGGSGDGEGVEQVAATRSKYMREKVIEVTEIGLSDRDDDGGSQSGRVTTESTLTAAAVTTAGVISSLEYDDFIQSPSVSPPHRLTRRRSPGSKSSAPHVFVIDDSEDDRGDIKKTCGKRTGIGIDKELSGDDALVNSSDSEAEADHWEGGAGSQRCTKGKILKGKKRLMLKDSQLHRRRKVPKRSFSRGRASMTEVFDSDSERDNDIENESDDESKEGEEELFFCDRALTKAKNQSKTKTAKKKIFDSPSSSAATVFSTGKGRGSGSCSPMSHCSCEDDTETTKMTWQNIFSGSINNTRRRAGAAKSVAKSAHAQASASGTGVSAKKRQKQQSKRSDDNLITNPFKEEKTKKSAAGLLHKIVVFAHHKKVMDALEVSTGLIHFVFDINE